MPKNAIVFNKKKGEAVSIITIKYKGRELKPYKAIVSPLIGVPTVLTQSSWDFVSLWLKKEGHKNALLYWHQSEEFNKASQGMPIQSSPLLHYYSYMNAVKALLTAKNISFDQMHGVKAHNMRGSSNKISIVNEGINILNKGILPALSTYLGEKETNRNHNLQELLFNLPYIHRTYCISYPKQTEMFIPLVDCCFVADTINKYAYFSAKLSKDFCSYHVLNRLPSGLIKDETSDEKYKIKSIIKVPFLNPKRPSKEDLNQIKILQKEIRQDIHYINGSQTLWYAKSVVAGPKNLQRFPITITLAAMHRLSEICRYRPLELASFLNSQKNWLLSEFIQESPLQFIDAISSEITGYQFLVPNVRSAQ